MRRDRTGEPIDDDYDDDQDDAKTFNRNAAIQRIRATLRAHPITAQPTPTDDNAPDNDNGDAA